MHNLPWTDLQHVLAVAEHGSLASAARALGVNHTTVLRRVRALERRLGVRLFDHLRTGYALTTAGEELAAAARQMQDTAHAVERRLLGKDLRITGTVRVTTTDTLAVTLMPAALAKLQGVHPEIRLELTTATALANLSKRDADVAVRPTVQPPAHLVGRRVAEVAFALYGAPAYLSRVPAKRDLARHTWLAPDDSLATTTIARWMSRELAGVRPVLRADTLTALAHAALAGHGLVALPCYLGDSLRGLRRARGVIAEMKAQLWVLTHEDLRSAARIRAVTDGLFDALVRDRDLIEGKRPRAA